MKDELGFDDCLDHRAPDLAGRLAAACPNGIDIYFENVAGPCCDAVLPLLNTFARIPICGTDCAVQRHRAAARPQPAAGVVAR